MYSIAAGLIDSMTTAPRSLIVIFILQIGIPKMPNVAETLLPIRSPRGLAANILINADDENFFHLKLNNFIIIDFQTHQAVFMRDLVKRSTGKKVEEAQHQRAAEMFGDCCSKLAYFCIQYANFIQHLSNGNFKAEIPTFNMD